VRIFEKCCHTGHLNRPSKAECWQPGNEGVKLRGGVGYSKDASSASGVVEDNCWSRRLGGAFIGVASSPCFKSCTSDKPSFLPTHLLMAASAYTILCDQARYSCTESSHWISVSSTSASSVSNKEDFVEYTPSHCPECPGQQPGFAQGAHRVSAAICEWSTKIASDGKCGFGAKPSKDLLPLLKLVCGVYAGSCWCVSASFAPLQGPHSYMM
jgi:hypothetical protein